MILKDFIWMDEIFFPKNIRRKSVLKTQKSRENKNEIKLFLKLKARVQVIEDRATY